MYWFYYPIFWKDLSMVFEKKIKKKQPLTGLSFCFVGYAATIYACAGAASCASAGAASAGAGAGAVSAGAAAFAAVALPASLASVTVFDSSSLMFSQNSTIWYCVTPCAST